MIWAGIVEPMILLWIMINHVQWNPREINKLEVNFRLKSIPHGGPDFFLLCLSNFISLKVNELGQILSFYFQILLSHHNNDLTAPCDQVAASDLEGESGTGSSCGWTVTNAWQYYAAHWWISHHSSRLCLIGLSQITRTVSPHTHPRIPSLYCVGLTLVFLGLSLSTHSALIENLYV